jgi:nitrogen fixation NifU-like protein
MGRDTDRATQEETSGKKNDYIIEAAKNSPYLGRINDPTSGACVKGVCGDEMELYLVIEENTIKEIKFYPQEGCIAALICGHITCQLAAERTIREALGISPKDVIERLYGLEEDHCHCSILSVSTLHRAIASYVLKK